MKMAGAALRHSLSKASGSFDRVIFRRDEKRDWRTGGGAGAVKRMEGGG